MEIAVAPRWIAIQTLTFCLSNGLAVFDIYTDWYVVKEFKEHGIENPLIAYNQNWLNAWYFFTVVGTILTVVSFLHDGLNLMYSMYISCSRCCSKPCCRRKKSQMDVNLLDESGVSEGETEVEKEGPKEKKVTDPCKCCYRWGFNAVTRNENLAMLHLWFQNVPLLILGILYAMTLFTCERPDPINRDELSHLLRNVMISVSAAMLASIYRLIRSSYRMFKSVGVRVKGTYCCRRLLPKNAMNAVYPPNTRCQIFVIPYYVALVLQYTVINLMGGGAFIIGVYLLVNEITPNSNSSLGVYRSGFLNHSNDVRLFTISGNLIPHKPNESFFYLELLKTDYSFKDMQCLSEFEYSPSDTQIYYNTAQLRVVSSEGSFCNASYEKVIGTDNYDYCDQYYTISDINLFYASGEPGTSSFSRFDETCIFFINSFFKQVPKANFNINPHEVINTTGFPKHGEKLLMYSPPPVDAPIILEEPMNMLKTFIKAVYSLPTLLAYHNSTIGEDIICVMYFWYNPGLGVVSYSYREMYDYGKSDCSCTSRYNTSTTCMNLRYAYKDSQTQQLVELKSCYKLPDAILKPIFEPQDWDKILYDPSCPCF